ncbi:MAG: hypothetical protein R3F55_09650 [Alphaproteobacteria bacterium]
MRFAKRPALAWLTLGLGLAGPAQADEMLFEVDLAIGAPVALAADPTGVRVAVADATTVAVLDAADGRPVASFAIDGCCIADMVFVDVERLAIALDGGDGPAPAAGMQIRDAASGALLYADAGTGGCRQLDFSAHGLMLVGACEAGGPVWSLSGDGPARTALLGDRPLQSAAIDPGGELAVFAPSALPAARGPAETVTLYQLTGKEGPLETFGLSAPVLHLDWVGAPDFIAVTADGRLVRLGFGGAVTDLRGGLDPETAAGLEPSPWGRMIAGDFVDGALIAAGDGAAVGTDAAVPMRGRGLWAFGADSPALFWLGQPPTYPAPVLRRWQVDEPF